MLWMGVDEAGRGPLAGPVVAAAVVFRFGETIKGLDDSKVLSEKKRVFLEAEIKKTALAWGVGWASVEEIDEINILQASFLAMRRAIGNCGFFPALALVDGPYGPRSGLPEFPVIKGDSKIAQISAASILAKQARDLEMKKLDLACPGYGFSKNMGYGTAEHRKAIEQLGISPAHRKTFEPVKSMLLI